MTQSIVYSKDKNTKIHISWGGSSVWNNCGGSIIGGFGGYGITGEGFNTVSLPLTKEIAYEVLDKNREDPLFTGPYNGFVLITDNVSTEKTCFGTRDFVNYLIDRKIGIVVGSPTVTNRSHQENTAVTCWIWYPLPKKVCVADFVVSIPEDFTVAPKFNTSGVGRSSKKFIYDQIERAKKGVAPNEHAAST